MIAAPARDPGFADHPVHGVDGQRDLFIRAMRYCRSARTAIDVGAHIGLWTRMMADLFRTVYAYEPVRENYDCLLANTAEYDNVRTQMAAIGDRFCQCGLTLPANANSGCWYVQGDGETVMMPLDLFGLQQVDLIKLDVEGAEGFVLQGAAETLRRERPVVVFEDNGLGQKHYGAEWVDPADVLVELHYRSAARIRKDEVWVPC